MAKFCRTCGSPVVEGGRFCKTCGAAVSNSIQPVPVSPNRGNGYQSQPVNKHLPVKSKLAAALLAFFLGGWGIHKFYLGQVGMGILYILLWWFFGLSSITALIDFILLLTMSDETFAEKYNCRVEK